MVAVIHKQPLNFQYNSLTGVTGCFLAWILHQRTAPRLNLNKIHGTAININWHLHNWYLGNLTVCDRSKNYTFPNAVKKFKLQNNHIVWNLEVGWYIFEVNYILYFIAIIKILEDTPNNLLHFQKLFSDKLLACF